LPDWPVVDLQNSPFTLSDKYFKTQVIYLLTMGTRSPKNCVWQVRSKKEMTILSM